MLFTSPNAGIDSPGLQLLLIKIPAAGQVLMFVISTTFLPACHDRNGFPWLACLSTSQV
jgi:hypothetical protein